MVVLKGSRENFLESSDESIMKKDKFIVEVPVLEEDQDLLREERKKTGRYLAVGVILFLVVLGLYHAISFGSQKMAGLLGAALTMFLYLLWLLYAAQRRKRMLKESERRVGKHVEKQMTNVLQSLNNLKMTEEMNGAHDNLVYSSSDEETDLLKVRTKTDTKESTGGEEDKKHEYIGNDSESVNSTRPIFVRTYSIA